MNDHYKILHLEDVAYDAELAARELRKENIHFEQYVVNSEAKYLQALDQYKPDIILCDHSITNYNSTEALKIIKARKLNIPFILITATLSDEVAINVLKDGADDYILKDRLKRLPFAVKKAVERYRLEEESITLKRQTEEIETLANKSISHLSDKLLFATKTAGIGIWEYSFEQNKIEADDILLSHYGLTTSEYDGSYQQLLQYIQPVERTSVAEVLRQAIASRSDVNIEYQVIWHDGSVHYIKTTAHLQCDELDGPCRLIGTSQNITPGKIAEQELNDTSSALHKALDDLKKIMDSSLDVICSINEYGKFVNVSAASEKLWGYSPFELIGKSYKNFVYQEDQAKTTKAIADITSGINMTNFENYQVHKNGSLVPMVLSARWDKNESMLYCIAREATEKKHADASLLISEQRFKDLVQGGSDLIGILNAEGNYLYASPNSMDILGFPAEELIGKNTFSFMHPDDIEIALQSLSKIADQKKIMVPPIRFLHKDGSWRWLDSRVTNFTDNPAINGIVINARDITANKLAQDLIKESEARLTVAQAVAKVGSWETDLLSLQVNWSTETYRILEIASETAISHHTFLELIHPDDRQQVNAAFEDSISNQTINTIEHRIVTSTKKVKTVEEKWRVITDENGKPVSVAGTVQDITERKKAQEKLKSSEERYRTLFEQNLAGFYQTNAEGKILECNNAFAKMLKYDSVHELLSVNSNELYFSPAQQAFFIQTSLDKKDLYNHEGVLKCKDGTPLYFLENISVQNDKDTGIETFNGIILDISKRKQAEEKLVAASDALQHALKELNNIMDSSLDIICTIDENGKFVSVSAASEQIWGFNPSEIIGKTFMELVYEADREITINVAEKIIGGLSVTMFENRYMHKNGSIVPLLWSAQWDDNNQMMYCIAKDAREKKRLEKNIEFERNRIQDLFYHAPTLIGVLKGRDYIFEMANDFCLKVIAKKDVVGKRLVDALPEVVEQGFIQILDNVYSTGKNFMASEILFKVDNEESGQIEDFYLNLSYQPYRDVEGAIEGIFFFAVDVTEQVLSRKKIELSERKYRQIVETAQEGIWLVDEHSKTTFVNHKMFEILGYSSDEMLGKNIFEYMDKEGKELAAAHMKDKKNGKSGQAEFKYISKSGKEVWTNISANPLFRDDGIYTGSLAMITDITGKRSTEIKLAHSETSLKEAQSIANIGNWEVNLETNIHFWSDEMYNIFGIKMGDLTPSLKSFLSFIAPEGKKMVEEKIRKPLENEQETVLHFQLIRPNGEIRYVQCKWKFKFDRVNNPIQMLGILQDVSQLKIAEIERSKMVKDLIQRNKDLEQFNYIVSHNLRAPVANIIGFADALSDSAYPESLHKEFLSQLTVSVSKLDQVIRDINGVLLVRQKVSDIKELLSLSTVVQNIQISIQNLIQQYNVTITTDFSEADHILSIKSFLHSILYNLISNSIKYRTLQHAPAISIKSYKTDEGIQLIFSDNGLGIDLKKNGESLFGLYKRFHLNIEGKGLGLFMTKSQIETLGGTIEVSSEINYGTTFKIYLPL